MSYSICLTEGFRDSERESQGGGDDDDDDNEIRSTNNHDMKWKARQGK